MSVFLLSIMSIVALLFIITGSEIGIGFVLGLSLALVATLISFNYDSTDYVSVQKAAKVCTKYNTTLDVIYHDGDFKCVNGAEFDKKAYSGKE